MQKADRKIYEHLLYDKRKYKNTRVAVVNNVLGEWEFFINPSRDCESQLLTMERKIRYHVALLDTGDLVCVKSGYRSHAGGYGLVYIGKGVYHHDEYCDNP